MRDVRKLRAFELADNLAFNVYCVTRSFPRDEQFGLTAQLRRAAISVPSNIVEGAARNSQADYLRFLDIAYGSVREVEYQLGLASRLGYYDEASSGGIMEICQETGRVLFGLIKSMRPPPTQ